MSVARRNHVQVSGQGPVTMVFAHGFGCDKSMWRQVTPAFEGDYKVHYHLAPPAIARRNEKGELQKKKFGPAMLTVFRVLAKLKGLLDKGLITAADYDSAKAEMLKKLIG